jgi:hypothetical protein
MAMYGPAGVGARRLIALVSNLPRRSRLMSANLTDGQEWDNVEELLALQCELIDTTNRLLYGANYKGHVWKALEIRRPVTPKRRFATPNEIHRFFISNKGVLGDVKVTPS